MVWMIHSIYLMPRCVLYQIQFFFLPGWYIYEDKAKKVCTLVRIGAHPCLIPLWGFCVRISYAYMLIYLLLSDYSLDWIRIRLHPLCHRSRPTSCVCPPHTTLPKISSLLAHRVCCQPNITALLGQCPMQVPAYLDLTPPATPACINQFTGQVWITNCFYH